MDVRAGDRVIGPDEEIWCVVGSGEPWQARHGIETPVVVRRTSVTSVAKLIWLSEIGTYAGAPFVPLGDDGGWREHAEMVTGAA